MELECPRCGKKTPIPARVCQHCGLALTSRAQQASGLQPQSMRNLQWGAPQQAQVAPPVSAQTPGAVRGYAVAVGRKTILNAIAGFVGSLFASIILWLVLPWRDILTTNITPAAITIGVVAGFCVPAAIAAHPAVLQLQRNRALRLGAQAGILGAMAMTIAALAIAQFVELRDVFFALGGRFMAGLFAWMLFGLALGAVEGLVWRSRQRALLSAAGGMLGGVVAFIIGTAVHNEGIFGLVGLLVGLGSGLLQDIMKHAWIRIVSGPNEGTETILDKDCVRLGSSDAGDVDIGLYQDRDIAPRHMEIARRNGEFTMVTLSRAQPPVINGSQIQGPHKLEDGDRIQIGRTVLQFRVRASRR